MANSIPLQLQGRFSFSSAWDFWLTEGTNKHRWPQPQQSLKVTHLKLKTEASVSDSFCSKPWTFKKSVSRKGMLTYVYCHFHGGHSIAKQLQEDSWPTDHDLSTGGALPTIWGGVLSSREAMH